MTSPSCLDIEIARSQADKITVLKKRVETINELIELRKQINDISHKIMENTVDGYDAVNSIQKLMEVIAQAEYYQQDSVSTELALDMRIGAFKKTRDLRMQIASLEHFNADESKLGPIRAEYAAADAHTEKICMNSLRIIYCDPDEPKVDVTKTKSEEKTPVEPKPEMARARGLTICGTPIMKSEDGCSGILMQTIGWKKSKGMARFPKKGSPDYELIEGCATGDSFRACNAMCKGATDYNGALVYACHSDDVLRARHMIDVGATDVQLGLVCGLRVNSFEIIKLMLENGAKVTEDIIAYSAMLKNDSIKKIIRPGFNKLTVTNALKMVKYSEIPVENYNYIFDACR